jgi:hypothetical protein
MGMDVIGNSPVSAQGYQFYSNIWEWHPLWQYCEAIAPDLIPADNFGYSNDGWGLNARDSLALADRLDKALASGETQRYEKRHLACLGALPPEPCGICGGTGYRAESPDISVGSLHCNVCHGKGQVANLDTHYLFSVENVHEFAAFLRDCGGFRIL